MKKGRGPRWFDKGGEGGRIPDMPTLRILGISGSSRRGSFNTALLKEAGTMLPDGVALEVFDVSSFPLFSEDLESSPPPKVVEFKKKVKEADAVLFATPEFNYSISAVLKNAIEWGNRPSEEDVWDGKPAAIVSASTAVRGGARAQLALRQIMVDLNMHPINAPQLYVGKAREAFDAEMRLTDEKHRKTLRALVVALAEWARRLKRTPQE